MRGLLDEGRGDVLIDYREGEEAVVAAIREAVPPGKELCYVLDAVSEEVSF